MDQLGESAVAAHSLRPHVFGDVFLGGNLGDVAPWIEKEPLTAPGAQPLSRSAPLAPVNPIRTINRNDPGQGFGSQAVSSWNGVARTENTQRNTLAWMGLLHLEIIHRFVGLCLFNHSGLYNSSFQHRSALGAASQGTWYQENDLQAFSFSQFSTCKNALAFQPIVVHSSSNSFGWFHILYNQALIFMNLLIFQTSPHPWNSCWNLPNWLAAWSTFLFGAQEYPETARLSHGGSEK